MPLKDYTTGRTNKILIGFGGTGLILSAVSAAVFAFVHPALQIEEPDGDIAFTLSDHGAIGVKSGSGVDFGNTNDCLKSGGSSGSVMTFGNCGSGSTAPPSVNTGGVLQLGDDRYVRTAGDTMTGALVLNPATDTTAFLRINDADGGQPVFVVDTTDEQVGIGIANPFEDFVIYKDSPTMSIHATGTVNTGQIYFGDSGDSDAGRIVYDYAKDYLSFYTADTQRAVLSGSYLHVYGTISGSSLAVSRSATISGALLVKNSITSKGSVSGSTIAGFNLGSCNGSTQKLLYNYSTQKFECGSDQTGGGSSSFSTGNVLTIGDARYVNASGDTMTGSLNILNSSNLQVAGSITGSIIKATTSLSSSGTLVWEGAGSGSSLWLSDLEGYAVDFDNIKSDDFGVFSCIQGIGCLLDANTVSASTIADDSVGTSELDDDSNTPAAGAFVIVETGGDSFDYLSPNAGTDVTADLEEETHATEHNEGGADALTVESLASSCTDAQVIGGNGSGGAECQTDANTTYTAGQGLTLNGTAFRVNSTITGSTLSGTHIVASRSLTVSGATLIKGNLTSKGTISGAILNIMDGGSPSYILGNLALGKTTVNTNIKLDVAGRISGSTLVVSGSSSFSGTALFLRSVTSKSTLSGSRLVVSGHANVSGSLLVLRNMTTRGTLSGYNLTISRSASISGSLLVKTSIISKGSVSGATLYAAQSFTGAMIHAGLRFSGAGLTDCDTAGTSKLLWDAVTKRFSCGTDQAGGGLAATAKTADYTASSGDFVVADAATTGSFTVTLPAASANAVVSVVLADTSTNRTVYIKSSSANILASITTSTAYTSLTGSVVLYNKGDYVQLQSNGTNWYMVSDRRVPHHAALFDSDGQSIGNGAAEKVLFDSESVDSGQIGDVSNNRITIRRGGTYQIYGYCPFPSVAGGKGFNCYIYKNGSAIADAGDESGSAGSAFPQNSYTAHLTKGDYIELYAQNGDTTSRNMGQNANQRSILSATEIIR